MWIGKSKNRHTTFLVQGGIVMEPFRSNIDFIKAIDVLGKQLSKLKHVLTAITAIPAISSRRSR